ncbi:MAG: PDDEXK nuclease domain-containing protein, partial [Rhodanobacteraceae bacterium]
VGREIVEEEQNGRRRAVYGEALLAQLAAQLQRAGVTGHSAQNLRYMRQFYLAYPALIEARAIRHAPRGKLEAAPEMRLPEKRHALRGKSRAAIVVEGTGAGLPGLKEWRPGQLHPGLGWTHYRTLLRVEKPEARAFYEIEAVENDWAGRELERQIDSLLFERLALSRDKRGLRRLSQKGQLVQKPADIFKDPMVMEFLGLPVQARMTETDLETALIGNLQHFLLELGKGFAFVSRQERLTIDGDDFYIDLVFYHTILKCYVIIDLKTGKLTHQDLGQLQLYVNYFDRERRTAGDGPTLGLILCTDKNDAVVQYTLGAAAQKTIFASRYKLHLPTESELKAELQREVRALAAPRGSGRQG